MQSGGLRHRNAHDPAEVDGAYSPASDPAVERARVQADRRRGLFASQGTFRSLGEHNDWPQVIGQA